MILGKIFFVIAAGILLSPFASVLAQQSQRKVAWVEITDIVGPATVDQVSDAVREAEKGNYVAIILALNTPGGLVDSMLKVVDEIQNSPVPVIGFVYPSAARALSAGTFILMATDFAVMSPFSRIGSAQPIAGGVPVNETKIINALVKQMEGFAILHKRNTSQLARFITHNDNLLPQEALSRHAIEVVASNPEDLLAKADGITVSTLKGEKALETKGATIEKLSIGPRTYIVKAFSDPLVSSLLVGLGTLILILGLYSPGWGAEVFGAVLLLLGLLGQGFNVNYVALILMGIGASLLLFELHAHGFGIPGLGGVIILGLGMSLFVTQPPGPILINSEYFEGFLRTLLASYAFAGAFFGFLVYKVAQVRKIKSRMEAYPSGEGRAVDDIGPGADGFVIVSGEYWKARSSLQIKSGNRVRVTGHDKAVLIVQPAENS